jgi:glycogen debranching enzyme
MPNHLYSRSESLERLRDKIDIRREPFSERGSRLLVYRQPKSETLTVKLAERLTSIQPGLETHRARPAYMENFTFLDGSGKALAGQYTTYPHALFFETLIGVFTLCFYDDDTLALGLPPGARCGVRLLANTHLAAEMGEPQLVREIHWRTQATVLKAETSQVGALSRLLELSLETGEDQALYLTLSREGAPDTRTPTFSWTLSQAEGRWQRWFDRAPRVDTPHLAAYDYAWWVMAVNLVFPSGWIQHEAMMPSKHQYIGVWNWDACFHALALRHLNPELARDQLRVVLAHQRLDGMLPDVVFDEGIVDWTDHPIPGAVTKPPVMAWAAWKLHQTSPDPGFLEQAYPALRRWNNWWFNARLDDRCGLAQYHHPYSSGLDDSPLWDHGLPVTSPDLNTYLVIQMESLGSIAEALGRKREASAWRRKADALTHRMLNALYDPQVGLFWALHDGQPIPERTPFNLLPLWTGRLEEEVQQTLVEQLHTPAFWGAHPLATVARNSANYSPTTMWRGPVWINANYFFIEALRRIGRPELAGKLREQTIELIAQNEGIFEYYNPETGAPAPSAAPIFGWSAALFIDLILQANEYESGEPAHPA